jgi:cobalamin biosynthesis protein CobD/CbiB
MAALFCVPTFLLMTVVRQYYTWKRPQSPDAATGRVISVLVNYGKTVYVTATEQRFLYGTYIVLGLAVMTTFTLYILARRGRVKSK